ncbi:MAG TPA: DUF3540 domain-containing protein [Desulfobulbus sp.]|nr:DUF3540 domain-containing protein [Desulfobulbus sp.]
MTNLATLYDTEEKKNIWGPARILSIDPEQRIARIYLDGLSGIQEIHATLALPIAVELAPDDRVLVAGEDIDSIYIIGVLSVQSPPTLRARDGSYVVLDDSEKGTFFQLYSKEGELLVEHDAEAAQTRIHAGAGDIEVSAPGGDMVFRAQGALCLRGETISLQGKRHLDAAVLDRAGRTAASLSLAEHGGASLRGADLRLTAGRAGLLVDELKITGKRILGSIGQATINADRLETRARSVISKARNLFQAVENLTQLKTGRLKTLIRSTYHLKSKNTIMKSEDDFKVKADRINLG